VPLLSALPVVTFPDEERHRPSTSDQVILLGDRNVNNFSKVANLLRSFVPVEVELTTY